MLAHLNQAELPALKKPDPMSFGTENAGVAAYYAPLSDDPLPPAPDSRHQRVRQVPRPLDLRRGLAALRQPFLSPVQ
jgi:hypothetical protein